MKKKKKTVAAKDMSFPFQVQIKQTAFNFIQFKSVVIQILVPGTDLNICSFATGPNF